MKCGGRIFPQGRTYAGVVKGKALAAADALDESGQPKRQQLNDLFALNRRVMKAYF